MTTKLRNNILTSMLMAGLFVGSAQAMSIRATQNIEKLPSHVNLPEQAMSGYGFAADVHMLKSNKLKLSLPDGSADITLRGNIKTRYPNGSKLWVGNVESDPFSSALLTQHGKAFAGVIRSKGRVFKLQQTKDGLHILMEVSPREPMPEADPVQSDTAGSATSPTTSSDTTTSSQIDIMVVYSTNTKNAYGGVDGINAHIAQAIAESNQAYANSQIDAQLRLVHTAEVENTSGNMSTDLSALRSTTDGALDEVHGLRDQYGADMVSWFNEQGSYCGIAYVNKGDINADAAYGFSVVNSGCATGYFSTAHELGHNMGSLHDEGTSAPSEGIYPYSYGYQDPNRQFRTVMAYNCPDGGCIRQQFFSNPNLQFNGAVIGTADADNARSINQTREAVAGWRVELVDTPPVANFEFSCTLLDCSFTDLSNSSNPISWDWNFDDGSTSTQQNPTHSFGLARDYQVQLTVTDDTGASASHIETVSVTDEVPALPEKPVISSILANGADVMISWSTAADASEYSLERQKQHPKNGKWNGLTTITAVTTPYTDQPGSSGTYRYRLIAHNQYGTSAPTSWVEVNVVDGSSGGGKGNNGRGKK